MAVESMQIAVLSGKGGTGKTLVSVNLAAVAERAQYIDCDVEEPNGHLFFQPQLLSEEIVTVRLPVVDATRCVGCRKCVDFCKFNALAFVKNKPFLFEEVCHSCGGCVLLCPEDALSEIEKPIGVIQNGVSEGVQVRTGVLHIGESSGVPIIRSLLAECRQPSDRPTFIDCPPGSACIVMESIKDADFCVLVAEPTLFGVHNLQMVYELVRLFQKPHGVVLNKCQDGENPAEIFCIERNIPILGKIPFDRTLGAKNADAKIIVREHTQYRDLFLNLLDTITKEVRHETAAAPQR